jgi:hypothetical protein
VRLELTAAGRRNDAGWYSIAADEAAELILYPTVTGFLDHAGMVEFLGRRGRRMAAAGRFRF